MRLEKDQLKLIYFDNTIIDRTNQSHENHMNISPNFTYKISEKVFLPSILKTRFKVVDRFIIATE